ncbi:MAG TPA: S8 family serine peptidase [Gaiellaceae bacterium]|nr:S8 family serine peptidase [Gaiellaceae bacterium]
MGNRRSHLALLLVATFAVAGAFVPAPAFAGARGTAQQLVPNDPLYAKFSWPAASINLPQAWHLTLGSPSVTIAVLDTGVSPVPDLAGALVPGYNFVADNTDTTDDNGHGTEVASIAAARTNNGIGIAGVCARCSIMPVKVLDANAVGSPGTVAEGVTWAAAHGAQIINLSLYSTQDNAVLSAAIEAAVTQGVVVVVAAGNSGSSNPALGGFPAATSPDAIRVGGVNSANALYGWSDSGSWVDVAAPGAAAAATTAGYALGIQGTSVATPIVSGVVGLMLSYKSSLGPAAVKSILESTSTPVIGLQVASAGTVDAYAALVGAGALPATTPAPSPSAQVVVKGASQGTEVAAAHRPIGKAKTPSPAQRPH